MKDAVVAASCCCGAAAVASAFDPARGHQPSAEVQRQACCETRSTPPALPYAARTEAAPELPVLGASVAPVIVLQPPSPPAPAPAWACSPAMRDPGRPLVLLKHALLV